MGLIRQLYGDRNREEFIRTLDSVLSVILQLVSIGIQGFGLLWMMKHYH